MATEHAEKMAAAVKAVAPTLRERGFRKRRNTFNREPEPGLVQVLGFQLGEYLPGDLYGRFTVNLGLWFEEAAELSPWPRPAFVNVSACHLTQRLGFLLDEPADTWWSLSEPGERLVSLVDALVSRRALPFLDRLDTRVSVLAGWHERDRFVSEDTVAPFVIAALHARRGEKDQAERVLARELRNLGPGHPKVKGILEGAAAMGLHVRA